MKDLGKGIKAGIINITPEQAKKMLENNDHNRSLARGNVAAYAHDMINGNWQFNGVPILMSDNGMLLDGQTRLNAIVKANISQDIVVIVGLPSEVFKTIDTGRKRNGSDVLTIEGVEPAKARVLAALIVRILKGIQSNTTDIWSSSVNRVKTDSLTQTIFITNGSIVEYYRTNKSEVTEVVDFTTRYVNKSKKVLFLVTLTYAFWNLRRVNINDAEEFYIKLATGEGLSGFDPAFQLREKLISIKNSDTEKVPAWHYPALIYKAWNSFRKNEEIKKLYISKTETKPVNPI